MNKNVRNATGAEALACPQALTTAGEMGFRRLVVEGNSLTAIKKVSAVEEDISVSAAIINECREKVKHFEEVTLTYLPWKWKGAAHVMAQEGKYLHEPRYWIEEAPPNVKRVVDQDRMNLETAEISTNI